MAAAGVTKANRELVAHELAATAGEDGRTAGKTCALLLAAAGGEPPDAASLWEHGAADRLATLTSRVGEPPTGSDFSDERGRGRRGVGGIRRKGRRLLATGPSGGAERPSRDCRAGIQEKKTSLSGSKTHPWGYADVGREAKKEIVVKMKNEPKNSVSAAIFLSAFLLATCCLGQEPKEYTAVIPASARTQNGVFKVHQVGAKIFYEIPRSELVKPFLWLTRIARAPELLGFGNESVARTIVVWDLKEDKVLLCSVQSSPVADPALPISRAVAAVSNPEIIQSFPVQAYGPDRSLVIDVTNLFATDVPEFSMRARLKAQGFDANRSFIERVRAYPTNIEVESTYTYTSISGAQPEEEGLRARNVSSASFVLHHSMRKLPEVPMRPRLADEIVRQPPAAMRSDWTAVDALSAGIEDFTGFLRSFRNKILPDGTLDDRASPELGRIRREIEKQKRQIQESLRGYLRKLAEGGTVSNTMSRSK